MPGVPLSYQIHVILALLIFGIWPFTRLVHIWSLPIAYITRGFPPPCAWPAKYKSHTCCEIDITPKHPFGIIGI